jgi:type I restriction enzyme M protein
MRRCPASHLLGGERLWSRELWQKMRKSLGAKRKELSGDHIAEITKLYGAFEDSDRVKILPNEAFSFLRITVERPLRLRWEVTTETLAAIRADKRLAKCHPEVLNDLVEALAQRTDVASTDRAMVAKVVDPILRAARLSVPQLKAVWEALVQCLAIDRTLA